MKDSFFSKILQTVAAAVSIGLYFWAEKLIEPIRGREFKELSQEVVNRMASNFSGNAIEVVAEPHQTEQLSFDLLQNLFLPMVIFLVTACILCAVLWFIGKSLLREEDSPFHKVLKGFICIGAGFMAVVAFLKGGQLLLLNIGIALVVVFICMIAFSVTSAFFSKKKLEIVPKNR